MLWTWFVNSCIEDISLVVVLVNAIRNVVVLLSGSEMVQGSQLVFHLSEILVSEMSWFAVFVLSYINIASWWCVNMGMDANRFFYPLPDIIKNLFVYSLPVKIIFKCLPLLKRNIKVAPVGNGPILFLARLFHQGKQNCRSANAHSTREGSFWNGNIPIVRKKGRKIICVK